MSLDLQHEYIDTNIFRETVRNAVVTGASRGIGKAVADEFSRRGYNVAIISRNYTDLESVAADFQDNYHNICLPFECDVRDYGQLRQTFNDIMGLLGSVDVLVNNAGVNSRRTLPVKNPDTWFSSAADDISGWSDEITTNLTGTYLCSYIAAGYMIRQASGSIINISSIKGKEATTSPGYGASKAGIIHLTKDFAKTLASFGIRVNCIAPGFIATGLTVELPQDKQNDYRKQIPQGRFGTVDEVAKLIAFLASDDASYITGATVDINGGYLMS